MKDYAPLLTHFHDFAKKNNMDTEQSAIARMQVLDKVKEDFNRDLNERDADSINELI